MENSKTFTCMKKLRIENTKKLAHIKNLNKRIINLTMHEATPEQGAFEPSNKSEVKELLLFKELPTDKEIKQRASRLAQIAYENGATHAMIGGALYLMSSLERYLLGWGVKPVYAFSERVSVEVVNDKGEVEKDSVFKHLGFIYGGR